MNNDISAQDNKDRDVTAHCYWPKWSYSTGLNLTVMSKYGKKVHSDVTDYGYRLEGLGIVDTTLLWK